MKDNQDGFLYKISKKVLNLRGIIILVFIALIIFSLVFMNKTNVTNDLSVFLPDYTETKPKLFEQILETEVPDQIISCPLELTVLNLNGTKSEYKCDITSGFYGMVQDKESFRVKPVIGYAIVVEDKVISKLTINQKNKIIDEFFN